MRHSIRTHPTERGLAVTDHDGRKPAALAGLAPGQNLPAANRIDCLPAVRCLAWATGYRCRGRVACAAIPNTRRLTPRSGARGKKSIERVAHAFGLSRANAYKHIREHMSGGEPVNWRCFW
jgi:hypothetical protein